MTHVKERRLGDGFVPGRPHMQFACAYKQFDGDHLHYMHVKEHYL